MVYDKETGKSGYDHMNDKEGITIIPVGNRESFAVKMQIHPDMIAKGAVLSNYGTIRLLAAIVRQERERAGYDPSRNKLADEIEKILIRANSDFSLLGA